MNYESHGKRDTKIYQCWHNMKSRCTNKKHPQYKHYGGRGIFVCKEWVSFRNFFSDMGDRPEGMTLERKDNNKGYSKDNCKWATAKEQANNRRSNRLIPFNGKRLSLSEWAKNLCIDKSALRLRLKKWTVERALTESSKRFSIKNNL